VQEHGAEIEAAQVAIALIAVFHADALERNSTQIGAAPPQPRSDAENLWP
jgi:hypothetical protein